jgi:Uma2 family endonuclease
MVAKQTVYFADGTPVVWDVDPVNEIIDCYRSSSPTQPLRFQRGQIADAEPAVPGWRIAVDEVFA